MPEDGGIGIHLTLDMCERVKFGPDVEWLPSDPENERQREGKIDTMAEDHVFTAPASSIFPQYDYSIDEKRAEKFYDAIRTYFPSLKDRSLQPDYSGIRAKICGPGETPADFMVQLQGGSSGGGRLINLFGIESPGLTSSLAIASHVCSLLSD
eukprot:TRINITY_DN5598_c0_g1_i1.p1 TRINITY_DN5598_c0_g1~~TRINITY_DN5598_c0_g1_i1.p1  ORF type:complete len:178 (-),score=41.83 TRINITY_DN5598_c0_g1_i1:63-521(-)